MIFFSSSVTLLLLGDLFVRIHPVKVFLYSYRRIRYDKDDGTESENVHKGIL